MLRDVILEFLIIQFVGIGFANLEDGGNANIYNIVENINGNSELIEIIFSEPVCLDGFQILDNQLQIKLIKVKCEPEEPHWKYLNNHDLINNGSSSLVLTQQIVITKVALTRHIDRIANNGESKTKNQTYFKPIYCDSNSHGYCGKRRTILTQEILNERFFGISTKGKNNSRSKRALEGNMPNSKLTASESPYEIVADIIVPEGNILIIERGVRLHFVLTAGLSVRGQLQAQGSSSQPIMMLGTTNFTRWKGLTFETVLNNYDVEFSEGRYSNEGYANVYFDGKWYAICQDNWNDSIASVVCKQMGYNQAASVQSIFVRPLDNFSNPFWPLVARCTGSESHLSECDALSATTTCKSTAALLQCLGSTANENKTALSTMDYVNVSNAIEGIVVNGNVPLFNYITVMNSVLSGITINAHYSPTYGNPTFRKCIFVSNKGFGIHLKLFYPPEERSISFDIDESLATAGGDSGLRIEGYGRVRVRRSTFFTNAYHGVESFLTSGSLEIRDSISASNGRFAMLFLRNPNNADEKLSLSVISSNITGHWYQSAIIVNTSKNSELNFENVLFWENYNGVLTFGPLINSDVQIVRNDFLRNRGEMITSLNLGEQNRFVINNNSFKLNLLSQNFPYQSVVDIRYRDVIPLLSTIEITNNDFYKNTMHRMINVEPLIKNDLGTANTIEMTRNLEISISRNSLKDNLVPDTIYMDAMKANISANNFANPVSDCELKMGSYQKGTRIFATNNYWGTTLSEGVTKKVCDYLRNNALMPAEYQPYSEVEFTDNNRSIKSQTIQTKPTEDELVGNIKKEAIAFTARNNPYVINASLQVGIGSTITIEPGVIIEFELDRGIVIFGQIVAIGTAENPIVFRSSRGQVWRGIYLENEASPISILEYCIIDSSQHGIFMNSDRTSIKNCLISNTLLTGITIGDTVGTRFDFNYTRIVNVQDIGLRIMNRHSSVEVHDLIIENTGGNGVDIENPSMNIKIDNVRLSNSRRYAIHIDQTMSSHQSVEITNCLITNQRGVGGVYLSGRNYRMVTIANTIFLNNSVTGLIAKLKCNYTNDFSPVAPPFNLWNNTFELNNDLVVDIDLMYCTNANISKNQFFRNNLDRRNGVLRIEMEPVEDYGKDNFRIIFDGNVFDQNGGDYSAYILAMNIDDFIGSVTNNRFTNNEHRRSVLILGSPLFVVRNNLFSNPRSRYYLEAEYNDNRRMDAQNNYWGTNVDREILATIFDGTKITTRGIVVYQPFLYGWSGGNQTNNNGTGFPDCSARLNRCNGHGDCIADDVCKCYPGYNGSIDCSRFSCEQRFKCSNNGWCSGPNFCTCYTGFSGLDCNTALCLQVNNCSGHGYCVSLNECQCTIGYTGSDCSAISSQNGSGCLGNCNNRGNCVNSQCQCYAGWFGRNCDIANCSLVDNCSGHGACYGPNLCNCFVGYGGSKCERAENNDCSTVCYHGVCNPSTRACDCQRGWVGIDCSKCENGGDPQLLCRTSNPQITYIVPTSISTGPNSRIYIYGENFERNYTCKFSNESVIAHWVSSNYIQCAVPTTLPVDKINFTVTDRNGQIIPISNSIDASVSFYSSCASLNCNADQSTCFHGNCLCFDGFIGVTCSERAATVPIDFNQTDLNPIENQPFKINFKLKNDTVEAKWVLVEGPKNMTINPITGELIWLNPIGSTDPIKITVNALTPHGISSMTMEKVVTPTYYPTIDTSFKTNQNVVVLNGRVHYFENASALNGEEPVAIVVFRNGVPYRELYTVSGLNNRFTVTFVPDYRDGGKYVAVAVHPGNIKNAVTLLNNLNATSNWTIESLISTPEAASLLYNKTSNSIEFKVFLFNTGDLTIRGIGLTKKSNSGHSNVQYGFTFETNGLSELVAKNNATANVYLGGLNGYTGPILFQFVTTTDSITSDWVITLAPTDFDKPWLIVNPPVLSVTANANQPSGVYEISIQNMGQKAATGINFQHTSEAPLSVVYVRKGNTLYNLSSNPYISVGPNESLTVAFGILVENIPAVGSNGSINVTTSEGTNSMVIYFIKRAINLTFDAAIIFITSSDKSNVSTEAVSGVNAKLENSLNGFKQTAVSLDNGIISFANISEGYYQLTANKPGYKTFVGAVFLSANTQPLQIIIVKESDSTTVVLEKLGLNSYTISFINQTGPINVPYIKPIEIIVHLNNLTNQSITTDVISVGNNSIDFLPFQITGSIPIIIEKPDLLSLPNNSIATTVIKVAPNGAYLWNNTNIKCDAYLFHAFYNYSDNNTQRQSKVNILVKNDQYESNEMSVCEVNDQNKIVNIPISHKENVYCSCRNSMQSECTKGYEPLSVCSTAQFSDNPGLETIIQYLDFINTCSFTQINIETDAESLKCILDISNICPTSDSVFKFQKKRDSGKNKLFDQISFSQSVVALDNSVHNMNSLLPVLFELADQPMTNEILHTFSNLFMSLKRVLDFDRLDIIMGSWYSNFKKAVADISPGQEVITDIEMKNILENTNPPARLIISKFLVRWNETVKAWSQGNIFPQNNEFISFPLVSTLANTTAYISAVSRENNFRSIFKLLDENVAKIKPAVNASAPLTCLEATVNVNPETVEENGNFVVNLFLKNVQNYEIVVNMNLSFIPQSSFDQTIYFSFDKAGTDFKNMSPGQVTSTQWVVSATNSGKLLRSYPYKAAILLSFGGTGSTRETSRLYSRMFIVKPKPSLKVFYFIQPIIPLKWEANDPNPYNVLLILMNTGYTPLRNVQLKQPRLKVVDAENKLKTTNYVLQTVVIGKSDNRYNLEPEIDNIEPGNVVVVRYGFVSTTKSNITDFDQSILVDNNLVADFESEKFYVLKFFDLLDSGTGSTPVIPNILISKTNQPNSSFVYNSKTTMLHPVDTSQLVAVFPANITINGKLYYTMQFQIRKNNAGTPGVHGQFQLPFNLTDTLQLLAANRTNYFGNRENYTLPNDAIWVVNQPGKPPLLNFVDLTSPENEMILNYNFIFGEPNKNGPQFQKVQNSVIIPQDNKAGSLLTDVSASDSDGDRVTYKLYGGDGVFAIDGETGQIVQRTELPLDKAKFCLVVRAMDNGVPPRSIAAPLEVSVKDAVDFSGSRCEIYNDFDERQAYVVQSGLNGPTTGFISVVQTLIPTSTFSSTSGAKNITSLSSSGYISVTLTQTEQNAQSSGATSSNTYLFSISTSGFNVSTENANSLSVTEFSMSTTIVNGNATVSSTSSGSNFSQSSTSSSNVSPTSTSSSSSSSLSSSTTSVEVLNSTLVSLINLFTEVTSENVTGVASTFTTTASEGLSSGVTVTNPPSITSTNTATEQSVATTEFVFPTLGIWPGNFSPSTSSSLVLPSSQSSSSTTLSSTSTVSETTLTSTTTSPSSILSLSSTLSISQLLATPQLNLSSTEANLFTSTIPTAEIGTFETSTESFTDTAGAEETTEIVLPTLAIFPFDNSSLNNNPVSTQGSTAPQSTPASVSVSNGNNTTGNNSGSLQPNTTNVVVDQSIDQNGGGGGKKPGTEVSLSPDYPQHDDDYDKLVAIACKTGQGKPILGVVCQLGKGTIKNPRFLRLLDSP